MRKSSFHFITGDRPLNQLEEGIYRLSYLVESLLAKQAADKFPFQPYTPRLDADRLFTLFGDRAVNGSTSRILCFDFLLEMGAKVFGPDKSVIDLGCGSGVYARHLRRAFGFRDYRGYDLADRPEWAEFAAPDAHFAPAVLGEDWIDVDDTDVIFSQSVLEHIHYDHQLFRRFRTREPRRLRHFHLVPATRSFFEHRLHGYRRYALPGIERLLTLPGIGNVEIYGLGNWVSREMHWAALKKPRRSWQHDKRVALAPYDNSRSVVDNMRRNRDHLVPDCPQDAGSFGIIFDQDVAPGGD